MKRYEITINKNNDEIDKLKVLCENLNTFTSMLKLLIGKMITTIV
ncbi:hypothetical protein QEW_2090 [Clostridioides difficile CD160]|nr:hypothetical protein QEW_2090 [Clostridioides difficile CD160]